MQQAMFSICQHLIEWVDNLVLDLAIFHFLCHLVFFNIFLLPIKKDLVVLDLTILLAQYVVYKISASAIYITDLELMKSMLLVLNKFLNLTIMMDCIFLTFIWSVGSFYFFPLSYMEYMMLI